MDVEQTMKTARAIVMKANDTVATGIEPLAAGETVTVDLAGETVSVTLLDAIPFGHKFALREIPSGGEIRKYGEIIGLATRAIRVGEQVHVHNLESCRGRGDTAGRRVS